MKHKLCQLSLPLFAALGLSHREPSLPGALVPDKEKPARGGLLKQDPERVRGLLQQRQYCLGLLVGLSQHGGGRLLNDLVFSQLA